MNKYIVLLILVFIATGSLSGQKISPNVESIEGKPIICYGSDEVVHHYVPAKVNKNKKAGLTLLASYDQNIPGSVRNLVQNGIFPILNSTFSSNIPINIFFVWSSNLEEGTLAAAAPGSWYRNVSSRNNLPALPLNDTWYPVALAEKLENKELNEPGEEDIVVFINSTQDWYFDFANPAGVGTQFDLTSVLLHEIYHGLGFNSGFGSVTVDDEGNGFIRQDAGNSVSMYMAQAINRNGRFMTEFTEGSAQLGLELTSNSLFFQIFNNNSRVKLYSPVNFQQGSSVSHVDQATYSKTANSLMTPTAARGTIERSGGLADDMMHDMGWESTSILHTQATPEENIDLPFTVNARVISDIGFDAGSVTLHLSDNNFATEQTISMGASGEGFTADIPAPGIDKEVQYYISVEDSKGKTITTPGQAPEYFFNYIFAIDNTVPDIGHIPVTVISTVDRSFDLSADVTDFFTGVDTVYVEYSINKALQTPIPMSLMALDLFSDPVYTATIELGRALTENEFLDYRIVAIDKSRGKNRATFPSTGFQSVSISPLASSIERYSNDFNAETTDFTANGLNRKAIAGFSSSAIHSDHPYANAGDNASLNFTYELNIPIKIRQTDPLIQFDEIVLVENGEPGVPFGQAEFWDYVIVEGKKLGERTWLPFLNGYDCRANGIWLNTYLGGIPNGGQDSEATATESLFRKRTINMTNNGNFSPGDEVLIRFRLLSDPFAVGWGWVIDNLKIQDVNTAVEDFVLEENFSLIPNPAFDRVTVALDLEDISDATQITLMDIYGRTIMNRKVSGKSKNIREVLDISTLSSGIYLVNVSFNNRDVISRKLVKQ